MEHYLKESTNDLPVKSCRAMNFFNTSILNSFLHTLNTYTYTYIH